MAIDTQAEIATKVDQTRLGRQPKGLMTLFFTEMWERFSYYGMRALLLLFLTATLERGGFGLSDETATAIYGLYTASVYFAGLPGGWIADRLLGHRNSVFVGGVLIACGHFSMALGWYQTFYLGLVLIVLGTGLLKPNVSAIVGDLYPESGARRDAGFSIFYSGINSGAFIGPIICGYLGENVNWHVGFAMAGIGMVLGLIQYRLGYKRLGSAGVRSLDPIEKRRAALGLSISVAIAGVVIVMLALLQRSGVVNLTPRGVAGALFYVIPSLVLAYFLFQIFFGGFNTVEKKRIIVLFVLFIASAMFWAGFEQAGSSMTLFADRLTDRMIGRWLMPTSWLQSVNPLFIIAFSPLFGLMWLRLGRRQPSMPVKFACGLVFLGLGFALLAWASVYVGDPNGAFHKVTPMWLVGTYFMHTVGELCLSPVGLSGTTKLSPPRLVGQMMGIWFLAISFGNLVAGLAAGTMKSFGLIQLFGTVALSTIGMGLVLFIFSRPVKKLMGGVE